MMLPIKPSVVTSKSISQVELFLQVHAEFFVALHEKQEYRYGYADACDDIRPDHFKLLKNKTVNNEFRTDAKKGLTQKISDRENLFP